MIDVSEVLQSSLPPSCNQVYDLVVIGGGVVGLACLRAATLQGWKCALVEAEQDLLSQASGSNSGIVCTGVDASPGCLERALIRDSISQFRIYCQHHGIPTRTCGSLVCSWPWDNFDEHGGKNEEPSPAARLQHVLEASHQAGDTHARLLSQDQIFHEMKETNLSDQCLGAVHIPGEIVVDSWLYSISLAAHALENGAEIFTNFEVDLDLLQFDCDKRVWTIQRRNKNDVHDDPISGKYALKLRANAVVNAAGIWSDMVETAAHEQPSKWTARPRRGQYRVYRCNNSTTISRPIQPIPTQRTKGIFVFSTIYNQLVVGPTAVDQTSRTDQSIQPEVAKHLEGLIQRIIPQLDVREAFLGEFVGIRPGTDQRDYQILLHPQRQWISVAGIRSTGLTASLGIGNYVMRLLCSILALPSDPLPPIRTTPMPASEELVQDFAKLGGYVNINGNKFRVTHPLSVLGLTAGAFSTTNVQEDRNHSVF